MCAMTWGARDMGTGVAGGAWEAAAAASAAMACMLGCLSPW